MPVDLAPDAAASRVRQSALTNGSRAVLFGDGRSSGARRYRDLCAAFAGEVGGMAALPVLGRLAVEGLAAATVEFEILVAERAAGYAIDPVAFCTVANNQRRAMRDLRAYRPKSANPLADHLARNYGQRSGDAK